MGDRAATRSRLRGIWIGAVDLEKSRAFYERLGASFGDVGPGQGIINATLGESRLIFEVGHANPAGAGPIMLVDVPDADAMYAELQAEGVTIDDPPVDEPWGRRFNVRDPSGNTIALLGPAGS